MRSKSFSSIVSKNTHIFDYGNVKLKKKLLGLVEYVLEHVDPYYALKNKLFYKGNVLYVDGEKYRLEGKLYAIAIGKAAYSMARALERIIGERIDKGIVITRYGYGRKDLTYFEYYEAAHPLPDMNSLEATSKVIDLLKQTTEKDVVIFLTSGGGSAVFETPEEGISLSDIVELTHLMFKAGMSIDEINTLRKFFSKVKGGKLLRYVSAKVFNFVISDVVGDDIKVIASAPLCKDAYVDKSAVLKIIHKYDIYDELPYAIKQYLSHYENKPLKTNAVFVKHFIVQNSKYLEGVVSRYLYANHIKPLTLTHYFNGDAVEAAKFVASIIKQQATAPTLMRHPFAMLLFGELISRPSSDARFYGGPNQEFGVALIKELKGIKNVAVLSMDSDGIDGKGNAAGAIVDGYVYDLVDGETEIKLALEQHNSYELLKKAKSLLITGPTYNNLNSFYVVLVDREA